MKKNKFLANFNIRSVSLAAALCLLPPAAMSAGLEDLLQGMFANVTSTNAFKSQSSSGLVGGSVVVRIPNQQFSLGYIDPPSFNAGCGGLDFHLGSFKFINADAIVKVFRQIAQNAVGALFKIAINAINSNLGAIMTEFQNELSKWSSMVSNTCKIGTGIAEALTGPPGTMGDKLKPVSDAYTNFMAGNGSLSSGMNSFMESMSSTYKKDGFVFGLKKDGAQNDKKAYDEKQEKIGNLTWRAFVNSKNSDVIKNSATGLDMWAMYDAIWYDYPLKRLRLDLLQNILGSTTYTFTDQCIDGVSSAASGSTGSGKCGPTSVFDGQVDIFTLLYDPSPTKTIASCKDATDKSLDLDDLSQNPWACTELVQRPITIAPYNFKGTKAIVNNLMWGVPNDSSIPFPGDLETIFLEGDRAESILGKLLNGKQDFSPRQKAIIESSPIPFVKYIKSLSLSPEGIYVVAQQSADIVAKSTSIMMADSLLNTARSVLRAQPLVHMVTATQAQAAALEKFEISLNLAKEKHKVSIATLNEFTKLITTFVRTNPRTAL